MRGRPQRPFTIADLMILIAATAVGLMVQRLIRNENAARAMVTNSTSFRWMILAAPLLLTTPLALLISRAMPPRPRPREVFRQPGTMACLTVVGLWLTDRILYLPTSFLSTAHRHLSSHFFGLLFSGHSVALTWVVMALAGVWRPDASWVDRAGRGLGIGFIVLRIVMLFLFL